MFNRPEDAAEIRAAMAGPAPAPAAVERADEAAAGTPAPAPGDGAATPLADWFAEALATPEALLSAVTRLADSAELLLSLEANALFLLGAVAMSAGGRLLLAVMGLSFLAHLAVTLGVLPVLPAWVGPALAVALVVAVVHLVLAILLTDETAGTVLVMGIGAALTLLLIKPLALLRFPGASRLIRLVRRN